MKAMCFKCDAPIVYRVLAGRDTGGAMMGGGWPLCAAHYSTGLSSIVARVLPHNPGWSIWVYRVWQPATELSPPEVTATYEYGRRRLICTLTLSRKLCQWCNAPRDHDGCDCADL